MEDNREPIEKKGRSTLILGMVSLVFFCMGFNLVTALVAVIKGIRCLKTQIVSSTPELQGTIDAAVKRAKRMAIGGIAAAAASVVLFFGCWRIAMNNQAFINAMVDMYSDMYDMEDYQIEDIEGEEL